MIAGIDRFLLGQLKDSSTIRQELWSGDAPEPGMRLKLAEMLGVNPAERPSQIHLERVQLGSGQSKIVVEGITVELIRWGAIRDPAPQTADLVSVHGEGLLLSPVGDPKARVLAMADAGSSPEQFAGINNNDEAKLSVPLELARAGCQVLVPTLIDRELSKRNGRSVLTNREYLHRPAFEMGRHLIGLELQKVLAAVDYWASQDQTPIAFYGEGEGGMLALYAGALDSRITTTGVVGYFGPREQCWQEPLDRNVFGRLQYFGDSDLARMIAPRRLTVGKHSYPSLDLAGQGGAPSKLTPPDTQQLVREIETARQHFPEEAFSTSADPKETLAAFCKFLNVPLQPERSSVPSSFQLSAPYQQHVTSRQTRQVQELDRHIQALLRESEFVRKKLFKDVDTTSLSAFENSIAQHRDTFRKQIIGHIDLPLDVPNARVRKTWSTDSWDGYEVKLDVFDDVFAYGALLLPKGMNLDQRRPVVVCQHGLEGRPTDTFLGDHRAYQDFAAKLCERGFIVFCPQNAYIFKDRFRTLQRKANPLGKTLFSIIVPQHQQIVNWLKEQSFVDPDRIAFYGLSYGGKSAMRIPALVTDYCLSICSADFNEWVLKNASTRHSFSYVWTGEYEIFEWNLGRTFNYFEMASLISPRPFMVERGHFDGVGSDEWVAYEYAKVRNLYAAKLKIPERTEIEWFDGPHTINGKGTFDFLHKHLNWPEPQGTSN